MKQLRDYQARAAGSILNTLAAGSKAPCLQLPTGSGKTVLGCHMARRWSRPGMQIWILVHRQELETQWVAELDDAGITAGVVRAGRAEIGAPVQVCSVQTLARRLKSGAIRPRPHYDQIVITDEAHHAPAATYQAIYEAIDPKIHLGLTATPGRLDGRGLGDTFDSLIGGPSVQELIVAGALADYRILTIPEAATDVDGVRRRGGDYARGELGERAQRVVGSVVDAWRVHARGRQTLVFAVNREHGRALEAQLRAAGADVRYADGETPQRERVRRMAAFRDGEYSVLVTVDLIGEGFDCEGATCAILARRTLSVVIHLQQIGRVLRPLGGEALIIDTEGNTQRLGGPRSRRRWSLDGRVETDLSDAAEPFSGTACRRCGTHSPPGAKVCVGCGASLEMANGGRRQRGIEIDASRLVRIDDRDITVRGSSGGTWSRDDVRMAVRACNTEADLVDLALQLGYNIRWVEQMQRFNPRLRADAPPDPRVPLFR